MNDENDDLYYDRSELMKAMGAPEYRESARFRDEVSARLQRSMDAGKISPMGEFIDPAQRSHTRNAYRENENANGYTVSGADPSWAEAARATTGCFGSPEEIAHAMSAPAWGLDPTYRNVVGDKIARSIREGFLNADLTAADPTQRGR